MRAASSSRAESRITGSEAVTGSARNAASRPKPSSPGMVVSLITSSGSACATAASAACPSGALETSYCGWSSRCR